MMQLGTYPKCTKWLLGGRFLHGGGIVVCERLDLGAFSAQGRHTTHRAGIPLTLGALT